MSNAFHMQSQTKLYTHDTYWSLCQRCDNWIKLHSWNITLKKKTLIIHLNVLHLFHVILTCWTLHMMWINLISQCMHITVFVDRYFKQDKETYLSNKVQTTHTATKQACEIAVRTNMVPILWFYNFWYNTSIFIIIKIYFMKTK